MQIFIARMEAGATCDQTGQALLQCVRERNDLRSLGLRKKFRAATISFYSLHAILKLSDEQLNVSVGKRLQGYSIEKKLTRKQMKDNAMIVLLLIAIYPTPRHSCPGSIQSIPPTDKLESPSSSSHKHFLKPSHSESRFHYDGTRSSACTHAR